jgi:hypothetical protein
MDSEKRQLIFGVDTIQDAMRNFEPNPMVRLYGLDGYGRTCRTCKHLLCLPSGRRYYKCDLRKITHGPATDHRVRWKACAKYERRV